MTSWGSVVAHSCFATELFTPGLSAAAKCELSAHVALSLLDYVNEPKTPLRYLADDTQVCGQSRLRIRDSGETALLSSAPDMNCASDLAHNKFNSDNLAEGGNGAREVTETALQLMPVRRRVRNASSRQFNAIWRS